MLSRSRGPALYAGLSAAVLLAACADSPTATPRTDDALSPTGKPQLGYVLPYGCKNLGCVGTGTIPADDLGDGKLYVEELQVCKYYPAGVAGDPVTINVAVKTTAANLAKVAADPNKYSPASFSVVLEPNTCQKLWRNGTLLGPDTDTLTVTEVVDASKWIATSQVSSILKISGSVMNEQPTSATTIKVPIGGPRGDGYLIKFYNAPVPPPTYTIGDRVWNDANGNGSQDGGESGLNGATVTVTDASNATVATTTTAGDGNYSVPNLPAGTYKVCVSGTPAGYLATFDLDGVGSPNCATVLVAGNRTDVDFGYTAPRFSIGDRVWDDQDGDGVQDAGEPGLNGVTVTITSQANGTSTTATTSGNGNYTFPNLLAGDYVVCVTGAPAGYTASYDLDGVATPGCTNITVAGNRTDVDFGYKPPRFSIGDRVWDDQNANGQQDGSEPGLTGLTVTVKDASNNVVATTTTGANGAYSVGNLLAGTYQVCVSGTAAGYAPTFDLDGAATPNCATITVSGNRTDVDFGYAKPGSIGDFVWNDLDKDGVQDAGEPGLAGVTVTLTKGALVVTTTTDANGKYTFSNVAAGTYTVTVATPAGYVAAPSNQGANDATDSDGSGVSVTIAGNPDTSIDFGFSAATTGKACTYTQGYWKNHEESWPAPYSPSAQWMTPQKKVTGLTWDGLFGTAPKGGNSYVQLAHQWMAAKLNTAQGAPTSASVLSALNSAEAWLLANTPTNGALPSIKNAQADAWMTTLDDFNNGKSGTPHCD